MLPRVSIVIPFYNCPYISYSIESLLAQTYPNLEIIVVDDGSTIHTDKIQPYLNAIQYIGKQNGGTASAVNHGFHLASGEYVGWLCSDDLFYPDKVMKQITFMLTHQLHVSFSNSDYIFPDGTIESAKWPKITSQADLCRRFQFQNPLNGCAVIMRKEVLAHVGMFDQELPYTHDMDLWIRILLAGYKMGYLDESLNQYRGHPNTVTNRMSDKVLEEFQFLLQKYHGKLHERIVHLENL
ncbi:glycosyltransferase family 2 protein [Paenibacillus polymyxa]|uniref:glycosyltransferase family 2 protein n=1 Tax=Paenibacillus polymyxa TaxID=1406 RepID=UPI0023797B1A|nr:glycosyltransferase [Paenibacillus polymyxa]WDM21126.1 glycosyltransferase [Paenibacillus polymyxa]